MLVPAVGIIEQAIDDLKNVPESVALDQLRELHSLGDNRARSAGSASMSVDFQAGYALGLQTARMVLVGSPVLAIANIKPGDLL